MEFYILEAAGNFVIVVQLHNILCIVYIYKIQLAYKHVNSFTSLALTIVNLNNRLIFSSCCYRYVQYCVFHFTACKQAIRRDQNTALPRATIPIHCF